MSKRTDGEKIIAAIEKQLVKLGFEVDPDISSGRDEKTSVYVSYDYNIAIESWNRYMYLENGDVVISACDDECNRWFVEYKIELADPSVTPKTIAKSIAKHLIKEMDVVFKRVDELRRKIK